MRRLFNIYSEEISISTVTLGELIHGVEKSKHLRANLDVVECFACRVEVIGYDAAAAYQFGQLKHELKTSNSNHYAIAYYRERSSTKTSTNP